MASSIDASTSGAGGVITTADNTGILQLKSGGTTIATISSTGITTQVGAPAFSAYVNSSASVSSATWTKIPASVEEFDTNNNYDNATNYRFTPTVAGYYQVNGQAMLSNTITRLLIAIRKNGSEFKLGNDLPSGSNRAIISSLIYMNGTSDYLELFLYATGTSLTFTGSVGADSVFSASMVRSA
jgi:hypothetical protein